MKNEIKSIYHYCVMLLLIGITILVGVIIVYRDRSRLELALAIQNGELERVKILLDEGADANGNYFIDQSSLENLFTPTREKLSWLAVQSIQANIGNRQRLEILNLLLQHGADANDCSISSNSQLILAFSEKPTGLPDWDVIHKFVDKGANVNSRAQQETPLCMAIEIADSKLPYVSIIYETSNCSALLSQTNGQEGFPNQYERTIIYQQARSSTLFERYNRAAA